MSERFYLPAPLDRPELTLAGPEAHHLAHVLRLGPGAVVALFDGEGTAATAEVLRVGKREVTLRPRSVSVTPDAVTPAITLAVAPPKGDRFRWLVEKATELGVARLVPLLTRRTVVDPREGKLDKLRQTVIAACKQSGRSRLMAIDEPLQLDRLLADRPAAAGPGPAALALLCHPGGPPLLGADLRDAAALTLLIGPEGGFTDDEAEQAAAAGVRLASLGPTLLRTETAALAAAAALTQISLTRK